MDQLTVAVIELGGGFNPLDVYTYCAKNGYPQPNLQIVAVDGAVPVMGGPASADGEICLDLDVIAAVAQGVKILVVFAPNTDKGFADAIMAAANHKLNPCAISISWGAPISQWTDESRLAMDNAIKYAMDRGIQVFCAAGDNGSNDGTSDPIVDYPAASPYGIGCGGTRLTLDSNGVKTNEKAWSLADGNGSTGGGYTVLYSKPLYQQNITVASGRLVPDVAGNADPVTGYEVDVDGIPMVIGGTSAVAPLYAALCALITSRLGQKVGNWLEVLYSKDVCVDVIGGSNGAYNCVANFDLCCGLGTIDGEKLLAALAETNSLTILDPLPPNSGSPAPTPTSSWWQRLLGVINGWFGKKPKTFKKHVTRLYK